jgi:hypothetical protein
MATQLLDEKAAGRARSAPVRKPRRGAQTIDAYAVVLRTMGEPLFPYSLLLGVVRIVLLVCGAQGARSLTVLLIAAPGEELTGL